jgi:hypothetical protein
VELGFTSSEEMNRNAVRSGSLVAERSASKQTQSVRPVQFRHVVNVFMYRNLIFVLLNFLSMSGNGQDNTAGGIQVAPSGGEVNH